MTLLDKLVEYVDNNPFADDEELANALNSTKKVVRIYLKRLENREVLKIDEVDGKRAIKVLEIPEIKPQEFKRGVYEMMIDRYLEDFKDTDSFQERIKIGNIIVKILEKM